MSGVGMPFHMTIGYARASAGKQTLDLQADGVAGVDRDEVFAETAAEALVEFERDRVREGAMPVPPRHMRGESRG
jgi:hypothetical protein